MENESVTKTFKELQIDINRAVGTVPRFYKRHLLNSINEGLGKRDLDSLSSLHRYFDYNLNFIDIHASKPIH